MTYSKLGNIKGPQGRRGLNMTRGATTPPAVDESTLEGDLWLDSTTGDVYRATLIDPWANDGSWNEWGTVLWKAADNALMVQPAEGDTGTTGEPVDFDYLQVAPWCSTSNNPSVESMTSVRSKGNVVVGENSGALFYNCTSLTDISALSGWDVSGVMDMGIMFGGCTSLANLSPISGWNTSGVTNMTSMFGGCTSLANLSPISGWNTSGVTNMFGMFGGCTSLANLSPISEWDVSGVTAMSAMFGDCTSLTDISALSGWNVSGVTDMGGMFQGCTSLTDISPISGWNTSGVTNMANMFGGCTSLADISVLSGWVMSGVTNMTSMFQGCTSLADISALSDWNMSGVTRMEYMFSNCASLADISALSGWNMSGVTEMSSMFSGCPLERIGIPSLDHGGKKFVSKLRTASAVANMDTTMLTNTTTHETMSANQILTDMDSNQSKYATGTVWTIARA